MVNFPINEASLVQLIANFEALNQKASIHHQIYRVAAEITISMTISLNIFAFESDNVNHQYHWILSTISLFVQYSFQ
ncbi:hypothetical protein IKO50_04030 [bacterium]|nr:hypothetical protein [bacterium]